MDEYYHKTIKALQHLRERGYDPAEIVQKWSFDAANSGNADEAAQMTLAIKVFQSQVQESIK